MNHQLVISLGSNCGNRRESVSAAIEWLERQLKSFKASLIYETPPVGHAGSDYMNAVVAGETEYDLEEAEHLFKTYELNHGRTLEARRIGMVPIDIDIVVANNKVIRPADFSRGFFRIGYHQIFPKTP